jgi:hypothetical protein
LAHAKNPATAAVSSMISRIVNRHEASHRPRGRSEAAGGDEVGGDSAGLDWISSLTGCFCDGLRWSIEAPAFYSATNAACSGRRAA